MKKLFKMIAFLLMLISAFIVKAKAETYQDYITAVSDKVDGLYVAKKGNGHEYYDYMYIIKRKSDNQFVYCIQPGVHIKPSNVYDGYTSDYETLGNITSEQWSRIETLAYYGYGYVDENVNHTDKKWYAVTQYLIWQTNTLGNDIYFTDTMQGKRINILQDEIAELNSLVESHKLKPNFVNSKNEINIGEQQELIDSNNVLSKYDISSSNQNISISKDGNKLYITANNNGDSTITFKKNSSKYSIPPIIYVSPNSQKVISVGDLDPMATSINVRVIGGNVTINKVDSETNKNVPQADAYLKGAKYNLYKEDGTYVTTLTTDENGYYKTGDILGIGKYYLQEVESSKGYLVDDTKYFFDITKDNINPTITVKENVIKSKVELLKVFAQSTSGLMTPEPNVSFDIYLKSNNKKVGTIKTDKNGRGNITLPYGTYIFKQITTTQNYEKTQNFEIVIDEKSDSTIYKTIANREIVGKLKVVKIDEDTKKQLNIKGIKFKIFDVNRNEYVKQTITYPTAKTIDTFETDENGILITPNNLKNGKYILEEVDEKINGYLWNKEKVEFEIGDNSNFIFDKEFGVILEVKFSNKSVKGKVNINKKGEKVELTDKGYVYSEIDLNNVVIGLYANEDIKDNFGKLVYKKDILIKKLMTNKKGEVSLDDLYLGKYYLKEIKTDSNYVLDDKKYEFELKYKDQYTPVIEYNITLKNYLKKGKLEFTKTDLTDGTVIPDTLIEIYTENNELVYSGKTDENGKIIIDKLPIGKYYIIEKEANSNYQLTDEIKYFEIKEDGEIVKANMTNEKIVYDIPKTEKNEIISDVILLAGVETIIYGLFAIIYNYFKRNKGNNE